MLLRVFLCILVFLADFIRFYDVISVLIAVFIQNCFKMAKIEPDLACFYQKLPRKSGNIGDSYEISGISEEKSLRTARSGHIL